MNRCILLFLSVIPITLYMLNVLTIPAMAGTETGIEGIISISPSQPGPIREGVSNSKPLPEVEFGVQNESREVTAFTTDAQGHFRVVLQPGHYIVAMKNRSQRLGYFGPFEADVVAGKMTKVEWACDSGMR